MEPHWYSRLLHNQEPEEFETGTAVSCAWSNQLQQLQKISIVNVISRESCCNAGGCFHFWLQPLTEVPLNILKFWSETTSGCTIPTSRDSFCSPQKKVAESQGIARDEIWSISPSLNGFLFLGYIPSTFPKQITLVQEDLSADEISHLLLVTQCLGGKRTPNYLTQPMAKRLNFLGSHV